MNGILLVDKPAGITSHDVVDALRKVTGIRKIGHTGTLDPAATGLLIMCIGQATRLSEYLTGMDKVYEGDMRLGVVTDSYDMQGDLLEENPVPELTIEEIRSACASYVGAIEQIPPMVSAVKVGGERLYKRARKGETVERTPRTVNVYAFDLKHYEPPLVSFRIACSRGTYVRAMCHDVGQDLGCGAALNSLRRTAVGKHLIENAKPLDYFEERSQVEALLLPMGEALELPEVVAMKNGAKRILSGTQICLSDLSTRTPLAPGLLQVKDEDGVLLALGELCDADGEPYIQPRRVFA